MRLHSCTDHKLLKNEAWFFHVSIVTWIIVSLVWTNIVDFKNETSCCLFFRTFFFTTKWIDRNILHTLWCWLPLTIRNNFYMWFFVVLHLLSVHLGVTRAYAQTILQSWETSSVPSSSSLTWCPYPNPTLRNAIVNFISTRLRFCATPNCTNKLGYLDRGGIILQQATGKPCLSAKVYTHTLNLKKLPY